MSNIIYNYPPVVFPLGDAETAIFEVDILSDATEGPTSLILPNSSEIDIPKDGGSQTLGIGSALRGDILASSLFYCGAAQVDTISVQYKINGQVVLKHQNPVADQPRPLINFDIQFTKP